MIYSVVCESFIAITYQGAYSRSFDYHVSLIPLNQLEHFVRIWFPAISASLHESSVHQSMDIALANKLKLAFQTFHFPDDIQCLAARQCAQ